MHIQTYILIYLGYWAARERVLCLNLSLLLPCHPFFLLQLKWLCEMCYWKKKREDYWVFLQFWWWYYQQSPFTSEENTRSWHWCAVASRAKEHCHIKRETEGAKRRKVAAGGKEGQTGSKELSWELELQPCGCMSPPTSDVSVYIHVYSNKSGSYQNYWHVWYQMFQWETCCLDYNVSDTQNRCCFKEATNSWMIHSHHQPERIYTTAQFQGGHPRQVTPIQYSKQMWNVVTISRSVE